MKLYLEMNGQLSIEDEITKHEARSADTFELKIWEGATEILYVMNKVPMRFSEIKIVGWNQTLQKIVIVKGYVKGFKDGKEAMLTPQDVHILDLEGIPIGYIKNLFVYCIDNKVSISFDRYEFDVDTKSWFAKEYK